MKKIRIKERSFIFTVSLGTAITLCIGIIFSFVIPFLILKGIIRENVISVIVPIIHFISSLIGVIVVGRLVRENRLPAIGISAGMYLLVLFCAALLLFNGLSIKAVTGIIAILTGIVSGVLIMNKNRGRGKRNKRGNR